MFIHSVSASIITRFFSSALFRSATIPKRNRQSQEKELVDNSWGAKGAFAPPLFSGKIVVSLAIHYSYSGLVSSEYSFRFLTIESLLYHCAPLRCIASSSQQPLPHSTHARSKKSLNNASVRARRRNSLISVR